MSAKQREALELIKQFSPKDFGVKSAFYRLVENGVEITFFVGGRQASGLISYLNSLAFLVEGKTIGLDVNCTVYLETGKKPAEIAKEDNMTELKLISFQNAGLKLA